ncbi:MAG: TlpA family protein disulfide reductase [Vicinamibacteria bacterium]
MSRGTLVQTGAVAALVLVGGGVGHGSAWSAEPEVSDSRAAFYRRAFPEARSFQVKRVPEDAVPFEDRGTETFVEVYGAGKDRLGYLRDFTGPVTTGPACPCHPLSVTFAFDASLRFLTLISEAPLEKYGHAPMTPEDMTRLIALAKDPPEALVKTAKAEDLVDAVTGATRTEYREVVVTQAALTTRRVASLVKDSVRLIRGTALAKDQQALRDILAGETNPIVLAGRAAAFLPQAETPEVLSQAYQTMAYYYAEALHRGAPRQPAVEARMLEAATSHPEDLARSCQLLANRSVGLAFVQDCIARLEPRAAAVGAALWALLRGTAAFEEGRLADALPALRTAADVVDPSTDPQLHLRLVQALSATGHKDEGCERVKPLFRDQPLLPGAETWLTLCPGSSEALADALREERHRAVASGMRHDDSKLPPLSLLDDNGRPVERDLSRDGRATVLIFFAAWCPHCQAAFPQFRALADEVQQDPKLRDKVRVVAVRTYTERDVEAYSDFARRFQPNFTVWADGPQGASLRRIAAAYGLPTGIPRLLVIDSKGMLRFIVDTSPNREMGREMRWAAEAVVAQAR